MFTFKVTQDDGKDYVVKAGTRDVLAWERGKPGRTPAQLIGSAMTMDAVYSLAYTAAKRTGKFEGTLSDFESQVEIDLGVDEEPDPTPKDR